MSLLEEQECIFDKDPYERDMLEWSKSVKTNIHISPHTNPFALIKRKHIKRQHKPIKS